MQTKQLYHQLYCGPKLLWADFVWAEKVMGRFCHGPFCYGPNCPVTESNLRCVLQRHKVSLANIRDWNTSNICLFYYFYALKGIFVSSGWYFIVNKYVLQCPIKVERPPIINMCTPKT